MEVRLHGPDRAARLGRDLGQRSLREEPQRDRLSVRLVQPGNGAPDVGRSLRAERERGGIEATAVVRLGRRTRVGPHHRASFGGLPQSDANRDPAEPRAERAVTPIRRQGSVGDHERLLGGVLGLAWIAEDPVAGANDAGRLALDEDAVRLAIAREDGVDGRAVDRPLGTGRRGVTDDDVDRELPPFGRGDPGRGRRDRAVAWCESP
jgi:hypothetical protein